MSRKVMRPTLLLALAIAASGVVVAHASTATTSADATIADAAAGIQVLSNVVLPTVISANAAANVSTASTAHVSNAALTIRTQSGDTLSMAVPESFEVIRSGGTEGLTVKTTTDTDLHLTKGGVVLGGSDVAEGTMSVNVGGLVTLASNGVTAPGPYEGTLVVLVQYN